jgi:carboxypeptidase PM20D1
MIGAGGLAALCGTRAAMVKPPVVDPGLAPELPVIADGRVANDLAAVIAVPTVSIPSGGDPAKFGELRDLLRERFPLVHRELELELVGEHAMLFRWRAPATTWSPIILAAHLDVVPVESGTEGAWTQPPFDGVIADGFVWGRGAMDDKLGVVGVLAAVESLLAAGFVPSREIWLAFGHDEEVGGQEGAQRLAQRLAELGVQAEFLLDEGGAVVHGMLPGIERPVALVGIAEKGVATLELEVLGEGGHSSMPPRRSTIARLGRALERLESRPLTSHLRGPTRMMIDRLTPELDYGPRLVLANLWMFAPLVRTALAQRPPSDAVIRTTTAVTMFDAGVAHNVLAARARATVNFRILPGDTVESVQAHVRGVIDDPCITVQCTEDCWDPSPTSRVDSPAFLLLERAIVQVFPEAVVAPSLVVGATDARYYEDVAEDVYRFLPMPMRDVDRARLHGTDERIAIADFAAAVRFYQTVIVLTSS